VPACENRLLLQIHHLKGRAHAGCHSPEENAVLCSSHHELHHEGLLAIEGSPSTGLVAILMASAKTERDVLSRTSG
jgi:hypothetical protein